MDDKEDKINFGELLFSIFVLMFFVLIFGTYGKLKEIYNKLFNEGYLIKE